VEKRKKTFRIIRWELGLAVVALAVVYYQKYANTILLPTIWIIIFLWVLLALLLFLGMWLEVI